MIKGQRVRIRDITEDPSFIVGITMKMSGPGRIGAVCFCVDASGRLVGDRYLVYDDNSSTPELSVRFLGSSMGDTQDFEITLESVPENVTRLVFVVFVSGPGAMDQLAYGHMRLKAGDSEIARYMLSGLDFGQERAVMLAEIYRKGDEWRLHLDGQGFADGIEGVFRHFGAVELWKSLASKEAEELSTEIVLTPEQAREILAVLRRPVRRPDSPHDGKRKDDTQAGFDEEGFEDDFNYPGDGKPPTIH
jgi:stress response protein SCP2